MSLEFDAVQRGKRIKNHISIRKYFLTRFIAENTEAILLIDPVAFGGEVWKAWEYTTARHDYSLP